MINFNITYTVFKDVAAAGVAIYYALDDSSYNLFAFSGEAILTSYAADTNGDATDFENTLKSTATEVVDQGEAVARATIVEKIALGTPQLVNSPGNTTIHTPASGKRIRLKWLSMASPDTNTATTVVTVALAGTNIYIWPMGAPGAFMRSSVREGTIDGVLTVNLSDAQDVYVNIDVEEF